MAQTPSTMALEPGTVAPHFSLPDTDGKTVCVDDFWDRKALLVMFICNHCPFVKHIRSEIAAIANEYQPRGLGVVAIMSNDAAQQPLDAPDAMKREKEEFGYDFPYLYDETQEVAKAYRAACTPDFFLFDADRRLVYAGQLDGSRPKNDVPVTGADLRAAIDRTLQGGGPVEGAVPSLGCNIKWRAGNEPYYYAAH